MGGGSGRQLPFHFGGVKHGASRSLLPRTVRFLAISVFWQPFHRPLTYGPTFQGIYNSCNCKPSQLVAGMDGKKNFNYSNVLSLFQGNSTAKMFTFLENLNIFLLHLTQIVTFCTTLIKFLKGTSTATQVGIYFKHHHQPKYLVQSTMC